MATPTEDPASAADLLNAAYQQLEFDQGALLSAARTPQPAAVADWIDRGDCSYWRRRSALKASFSSIAIRSLCLRKRRT